MGSQNMLYKAYSYDNWLMSGIIFKLVYIAWHFTRAAHCLLFRQGYSSKPPPAGTRSHSIRLYVSIVRYCHSVCATLYWRSTTGENSTHAAVVHWLRQTNSPIGTDGNWCRLKPIAVKEKFWPQFPWESSRPHVSRWRGSIVCHGSLHRKLILGV